MLLKEEELKLYFLFPGQSTEPGKIPRGELGLLPIFFSMVDFKCRELFLLLSPFVFEIAAIRKEKKHIIKNI